MDREGKHYQEQINNLKIRVPADIEEEVINFIDRKETGRKRFITRITSAAAVALLLISTIFFLPEKTPEMDYGDKLSALVEAYSLFPEEVEAGEEEILYEDELLIIYLK